MRAKRLRISPSSGQVRGQANSWLEAKIPPESRVQASDG